MRPFHWNCAVLGIGKELIVVHHLHHSDLLWKKTRECSRDPFAAHSEAFKPCSKQKSTAALNQILRILPMAPCAKCECAWQPPPHLLFQLHPSCGSCLHLTDVKTKTSFCSDCYDCYDCYEKQSRCLSMCCLRRSGARPHQGCGIRTLQIKLTAKSCRRPLTSSSVKRLW